ncbi:hypothetical protein EC2729250_0821 [Escherichia coli 2729250]|nr:hypothetical protein EC2860050_4892 [Escherichia coli 2860050]EMW46041.1 hypothetical protein EC2770900_4774 [Escherichia coli 2770900]EMW70353.1 hypothetical protein EC2749250_0867 [Escherichia coli 2749250]EMW78999.1 hypothetical protein EC2747800_0934 [Escherichia coli 2747800]EMX70089.1 hypothetical protein ECENVIRA101_2095 [Escherichia coli Envira 10/1]EMX72394.1 hypothetical protein ECENVIRA811_2016 [Escherichia coli Envira 8/11]EMZ79096.1 hypothetical protein ECP03052931_5285 [Esche
MDTSGGTRHLCFSTTKMIHLWHFSTAVPGGFFYSELRKEYTGIDITRVARP